MLAKKSEKNRTYPIGAPQPAYFQNTVKLKFRPPETSTKLLLVLRFDRICPQNNIDPHRLSPLLPLRNVIHCPLFLLFPPLASLTLIVKVLLFIMIIIRSTTINGQSSVQYFHANPSRVRIKLTLENTE